MVIHKEDFVFGTRAVIEAIRSGKSVERVLLKKGLKNELHTELFELIKQNNITYQFVPAEKINRVTRKNHQGVLAFISPIIFDNIETVLPGIFESGQYPLILMLDQVTDVRNFGAIVRSAECAGVQTIIIPEKGVARIGEDALKTSAGALNHIPVCRVKDLAITIEFLKNSGIQIYAATEKANHIYTNVNFNTPVAIIMGAEDKGISKQLLKLADLQIKIPILGKIESLNVSVSAALMIYEAVRQRSLN